MLRVLDSYAEILCTFSGQPFSLEAWRPYAEKISAVRQLCDCTEQEVIRALHGAVERDS